MLASVATKIMNCDFVRLVADCCVVNQKLEASLSPLSDIKQVVKFVPGEIWFSHVDDLQGSGWGGTDVGYLSMTGHCTIEVLHRG